EECCPHAPSAVARAIGRCLRKRPPDRFASGAELLDALDSGAPGSGAGTMLGTSMRWWRIHQLSIMLLYIVAGTIAWASKDAYAGWLSRSLFVTLGIGAAIGGIGRGHLLFTERMNRVRLGAEQHRTRPFIVAADFVVAGALCAAGLIIASTAPLWAVLTIALGVGIA